MELPGVAFAEDEQHQLVANFSPPENASRAAINAATLRECAGAHGFAELVFDEKGLDAAVVKIRRGEQCTIVIARRTDARYVVEIAPDKMSVSLSVIKHCGGKPADALDAVAALSTHNIREGVDATAVANAVENCGQCYEIATGTRPQPGNDALLEVLVMVNRQRHPHVDENGHVDFHDLGAIPTVKAGEALMRRHPPQPGIPGCNVFGETVLAAAGKDRLFAVRLEGVTLSPDDPNLLQAEIAGQPLLQRDGISVEPIVRYEAIDVSVGNIEFPGSIEVRGDIRSGMRLRAGGDITVQGVIESADVTAGGDIKVQGGIIGHSTQGPGGQSGSAVTARISASGSVSAKFIENATIEAQQTVRVEESIVQSEVIALDQVVVGAKGKKGRILGGRVRATALISADFLGGKGSGPTRIMVGINPLLQRALDEQRQRLDAKLKQHDDVSKVIKLLHGKAQKQDICDKARLTLKKVTEEIGGELERQRVLDAEVKLADNAKIVVGEQIAAGVTVAVGRRSRFINEDAGRGVFHLDEGGELGYGTLAHG